MERGYIKLWRRLQDNKAIYHDPNCLALLIHLLFMAQWKAGHKIWHEGRQFELQPGQLTAGRKQLAMSVGLSERNIRTCLDKLTKLEITTIKATNKYSIITILNWDTYQSINNENDQQKANHRPTTDQQLTTIKEYKHTSIKELNPLAVEFLDYFNQKTGKKLALSNSRLSIIESRLKIYTINQLKQAVDNFVKDDWEGRSKYVDVVYCIGERNKVDNMDKWLNLKPKTNWIKP